jgi:hypothetical protein
MWSITTFAVRSAAASTVRAIDLRYLERWAQSRKKPVLGQMGVDEIYPGKTQKFLTVVSSGMQRGRISAACSTPIRQWTK